MNILKTKILVISLFFLKLYAITGVVTDEMGLPIDSVSVHLSVKDTTVYTDLNGFFELGESTPISTKTINRNLNIVHCNNRQISISLNQPSNVSLSICNLRGQIVFSYKENMVQGFKSINIASLAQGIYLLNIQIGTNRYTQKFKRGNTLSLRTIDQTGIQAVSGRALPVSNIIIDTLTFSKDGYNITSKNITSYSENFEPIVLEKQIIDDDFKVIGYLPQYRFASLPKIELDKLTRLNISGIYPDSNGELIVRDNADISETIKAGHDAGLEVFIVLLDGDDTWVNWLTDARRSALVDRIVHFAQSYSLQGIDVDLEGADNITENYSKFVLELIDDAHAVGLSVTAAYGGANRRFPNVSDEVLESLDLVATMTYGKGDSTNYKPHMINSLNYWGKQGIEKSRLCGGVPFFAANPIDKSTRTFHSLVVEDKANALIDFVDGKQYNGIPSIKNKIRYSMDEGYAGIIIWELGQDYLGDDKEYSLLNAIYEEVNDR